MEDEVFAFRLPETVSIALLVIGGMYGNGDVRKRKLMEEGFNYDLIQDCVNELFPIVKKYQGK